MKTKYEHVFQPIRIRGVEFKNRIELAPPTTNLANEQGHVTPDFVEFYRPFALGGAAILDVGNALVDFEDIRDEERQLNLGNDACILPLTRFAEMCEGYGAHGSLEINHIGMDSHVNKTGKPAYSASSLIAPSELARAKAENREPVPTVAMDHAQICETVGKYAAAALRSKRAGCRMCMIHGGHGNLISQFSSPLYNTRRDDYGGPLENRARFTVEVLDRVRALCGEDFVIEFRISADEIHPAGMHFDETLEYIELIKDKIDILHVSAGLHGDLKYLRYWFQNWMMPRMLNVHFAANIKKAYPELLVNTVGSIMSIRDAEEIIAAGKADFVSMCRPLLADPEMPRKYALGREEDHRPCLRCQYCSVRQFIPGVINCAVNPYLGEELEFRCGKIGKAEIRKKVAVVGGGPAGIQATLTLCDRGHDVTLYEKSGRLGGNVIPAAAGPDKIDMADYLRYLERQAMKAPARILLNTEATVQNLTAGDYDALIIAVGARPVVPAIPGIDKPHVFWAPLADMGEIDVGKKTVIIGAGAVGVECAIRLKRKNKDVSIIEMMPDLSSLRTSSSGAMTELADELCQLSIPIHFSHRLEEVTDRTVICQKTYAAETVEFDADTVLLALGMKPRTDVVDALRRCVPGTEVYIVGDAVEASTIGPAVKSAFKAAAYI